MSPAQIAEALLEIGKRALPPALRLGMVLVPAVCLLWVIATTVGRTYVLHCLPEPSRERPRWFAIAVLNLLRALSVFGLVGAYFASSYASSLVIDPEASKYLPAALVFLFLFGASALVWSFVHWVLSLANIYAVRQGLGTISSIGKAFRLVRNGGRGLIGIASESATTRTVVAVVFTILALFPLSLHRWPALVVSFEGGLFLVYCLASDLLLLARLEAYAEAAEATGSPVLN